MSRSSDEPTRGARSASGLLTSCPRHNLACPPNRLVGREEELALAAQLLLAKDARLVTVSGVAGVGKTRLALAAAAQVATTLAEGAWFIDLAPIRDPGEVLAVVARTVGLPVDGRRSSLALLSARFAERTVLLVLDNFEQVLPAAEQVAALLSACPGVKVLATSRSRLQIRWERVVSLRPLPYEAPDEPCSVEAAAAIPAVALFVERAQASQAGFMLTAENVSPVLALSALLEGLPLAIELAAAHANVMTPDEMLVRMEQHLPALSWAARDLPARQRTLHDALQWSYELLSPPEQSLFRSLGAFAGGCTLTAAEAVAQPPPSDLDVAGGLAALVDASLVQVTHEDGASRFGLLETVREFACHHLTASGELDEARRRHAAYFLTDVEQASSLGTAAARSASYARLAREGDNLLAALRWSACNLVGNGDLRLACDLARIWRAPGELREGRDWATQALAWASDAPPQRLAGLRALGELTARLGDLDGAVKWLGQSLDLARQLSDRAAQVETVGALARVAALQGRAERLPELGAELATIGPVVDPWHLSFALHGLGQLAYEGGAYRTAARHLKEALELLEGADGVSATDHLLATRALIAQAEGDDISAAELAARSLERAEVLSARGAVWCAYVALVVIGGWAAPEVQARLLAGIDGLGARLGFQLSPRLRSLAEEAMTAARAALGDGAVADLRRAGRAMEPSDLVAAAIVALRERPAGGPALPPPTAPRRRIGTLSPRERQVLELMAEGLTNKQIAERLFVSVATVNFHVGWVLRKVGAENRTQAVILGAKQGLLGGPSDGAAVAPPTREPTRSCRPAPCFRNQQSR
jgi:predicted ATPase/DNA-binding CsgD family transcriptional regulator